MKKLWISCEWATGQVNVDNSDIIIQTPPIWTKFTGQHLQKLTDWLKQRGKGTIYIEEL